MPENKVIGALDPEAIQKIALDDLGEDPKQVKKDIKAIQDWIKKQPHLHKKIRTGRENICENRVLNRQNQN